MTELSMSFRRDIPRSRAFFWQAESSLGSGCRRSATWPVGRVYALGAYFGSTAVGIAIRLGMAAAVFFTVLMGGLRIGLRRTADRAGAAHGHRRDENSSESTFGFI